MKSFFNKNHLGFGVLLGAVIPFIVFLLILYIDQNFMNNGPGGIVVPPNIMAFLSIAINLLPFRYYMINLRYERTGRGILLSTFLLGFANVLYVLMYLENQS